MTSLEALYYLDDIAHGRKMIYDPHELEQIIEKELKALEIIKNKIEWNIALNHFINVGYISLEEYNLLKEILR